MNVYLQKKALGLISAGWFLVMGDAFAHDPVFSPGPHVLYKNGIEVHIGLDTAKQGDKSENKQTFSLKYGITGDWVTGIELPYRTHKNELGRQSGIGDVILSTKYRFWRNDSLAVQESTAIIAKVKFNSGRKTVSSGTTDTFLGFAYGYESLKWYRWASIRYRFNQNSTIDNQITLQRSDRLFVDLAGGYRPKVNDYREADIVWLLELNGEYSERNALNGVNVSDSGGSQWFVSPGLMWTLRNFAIKAGVQIPMYSNLNGDQADSDYRAQLEFEWHQ